MKRWLWFILAAVVLVAAGVTLVAVPQTPEWTTSSPEALAEFEAGDEALSKVYFVEAREHFNRAYELDPGFLVAKWRFAQNMHGEDSEQESQIIDDLMTVDVSDLTAREQFLIEYWRANRNNRPSEAARLVDECVGKYPDDPYILAVKAGRTWQQGSLEEAERLYQHLLKIDPNWVVAYNALGYIMMIQGRFTEAEEYFKSYRFIAPDQANPHDSLGELFTTIGLYDEAEASLERAIEIKPDFWASYLHLAVLKASTGDFEAIRRIIERARDAEMPEGDVFAMDCRGHYAEMADSEAWRQILDERDGECVGGFRNGFAAIITHRAACRTGEWEIARALEDEAAGVLLETEENGNDDSATILQAAIFHMQGVRLAIQGDFPAAGQRFHAADERLSFIQVNQGMYKLYNRMLLAETLLAGGQDAEAHQFLANVRRINPAMVEKFEASGFRLLGLGRG